MAGLLCALRAAVHEQKKWTAMAAYTAQEAVGLLDMSFGDYSDLDDDPYFPLPGSETDSNTNGKLVYRM